MAKVVKHAWTHRPRSQGGTDPIEIGGGGEWCRLGLDADFVCESPGPFAVGWDVIANQAPGVFDTPLDTPGSAYAIQPLVDGVYAATWSLYVDVFTPVVSDSPSVYVGLQHTTYTVEEEYVGFPFTDFGDYPMGSNILTGTKVFRSGPNYNAVWLEVVLKNGSTDLGVVGGDLNITYLEVVKLSSADAVGNANTFITGP